MKKLNTKTMVGMALFCAIVVVLQLLGSFIRFGVFSISLVLVPIVIGAALYGPLAGAILGFVFGLAVMFSGDANLFIAFNFFGTIVAVVIRGIIAGYVAGVTYKKCEKLGDIKATAISAIVCPLVNTGIFIVCCFAFFWGLMETWANGSDTVKYILFGMVGFNFLLEMLINILLSPAIVRIIKVGKGRHR